MKLEPYYGMVDEGRLCRYGCETVRDRQSASKVHGVNAVSAAVGGGNGMVPADSTLRPVGLLSGWTV